MSARSFVAAYLRERARLRLLAPLSILLAFAGRLFVAPAAASLGATVAATLEALAFVLAFRIWDDLEDRESDRIRHPERVLVSATTTAAIQLLGLAFAVVAIALLMAEPFALRRLAGVSLAAAVLSVWYGARSTRRRYHALGEHVLALKYPLIAYAVSPEMPASAVTPRIVAILAVVYVLILAYAYADDVELRQIFTSRRSIS